MPVLLETPALLEVGGEVRRVDEESFGSDVVEEAPDAENVDVTPAPSNKQLSSLVPSTLMIVLGSSKEVAFDAAIPVLSVRRTTTRASAGKRIWNWSEVTVKSMNDWFWIAGPVPETPAPNRTRL